MIMKSLQRLRCLHLITQEGFHESRHSTNAVMSRRSLRIMRLKRRGTLLVSESRELQPQCFQCTLKIAYKFRYHISF